MTVDEYQTIVERYGEAAGRVISARQDVIWAETQATDKRGRLMAAEQELASARSVLTCAHDDLMKETN